MTTGRLIFFLTAFLGICAVRNRNTLAQSVAEQAGTTVATRISQCSSRDAFADAVTDVAKVAESLGLRPWLNRNATTQTVTAITGATFVFRIFSDRSCRTGPFKFRNCTPLAQTVTRSVAANSINTESRQALSELGAFGPVGEAGAEQRR